MIDETTKISLTSFLSGYMWGADSSVRDAINRGDVAKAAAAQGKKDAARDFEEKLKELGIL